MQFGSICSGIEAASVAWQPLGWRPSFLSEIALFPRAVLQHRYPEARLHGDFTTIEAGDYEPIDVLVGGTPCQDFSVAGLRAGITGDRGNLTLEFIRLAQRLRPTWIVFENVPGLLSDDGGRAFGAFLGGLAVIGYGFAYRVLDAQFAGLAQRRERVFVIGYLGDWRPAAAVLFERHGLSWDPAPRRGTRQGVAGSLTTRAGNGSRPAGANGNLVAATIEATTGRLRGAGTPVGMLVPLGLGDDGELARALNACHTASGRHDVSVDTFVATAFKASHYTRGKDGAPSDIAPPLSADADKGDQDTLVATTLRARDLSRGVDSDATDTLIPTIGFTGKDHGQDVSEELSPTLRSMSGKHANAGGQVAIAFGISSDAVDRTGEGDGTPGQRAGLGIVEDCQPALRARPNNSVATGMAVRRLTPRECERLQGFPDDWTLVPYRGKPAKDGPRYQALGNSMAVPVVRWLGQRIDMVQKLISERGDQ